LALQQRQQQYNRRGGIRGLTNSNNNNNNNLCDDDDDDGNTINNSINRSTQKRRFHPLSPHAMNVREVRTTTTISTPAAAAASGSAAAAGGGGGRAGGGGGLESKQQHFTTTTTTSTTVEAVVQRERLGRNASIATRRVLDSLAEDDEDDDDNNSFAQACAAFGSGGSVRGGAGRGGPADRIPQGQHQHQQYRNKQQQGGGGDHHHPRQIIQRVLDMFQHPSQHLDYLNSEQFAKDLLKLASKMRQLLEREPRVLFVQSPVYVFGDIHGNLEGKGGKEKKKNSPMFFASYSPPSGRSAFIVFASKISISLAIMSG
jgi:hypothetical protein